MEKKTIARKRRETVKDRQRKRKREKREHAKYNEDLNMFNLLESAIFPPEEQLFMIQSDESFIDTLKHYGRYDPIPGLLIG